MAIAQDAFGRRLRYLRLSITDVCNFRCTYCLPNGYSKCGHEFLSKSEIQNLVSAFAKLNFAKIRITGGEPTTRTDVVEIASMISQTSGVERVTLSTNGYKLRELAKDFRDAGVSSINVSVDSLSSTNFKKITGRSDLSEILAGIDYALSLNFKAIKVNAVLLKDQNIDEIDDFIEWTRDKAITVRFIELMQTGGNHLLFKQRHVSASIVTDRLEKSGWTILPREIDAGPAIEYVHPEYRGRIGIIAPYAKNFCQSCNRLRVTSTGALRLCLFGELEYPLRPWLQSSEQLPELVERIQKLVGEKKETHFLHQGQVGVNRHFAGIGG